MDSADIYLKRFVLGLSIAVVLLLAALAVFSFIDQPTAEDQQATAEDAEDVIDDEPNAPAVVIPGDQIDVDDRDYPLSVACVIDRSSTGSGAAETAEDVHLLIIHNRGQLETDYVVSAELRSADGSSSTAIAVVDRLRADERREVVLVTDDPLNGVERCAITGVQGDRRVLLGPG